jgi:hypothetical protein
MRLALFMIPFLALAAPAAGAPLLALPVDCELGKKLLYPTIYGS